MSEPKPKRVLSPEQLDKLKVARAKANEVRAKQAMVKKAEKMQKNEQLEAKFNTLVASKQDNKPEVKNEVKNEVVNKPVNKPKVKKVVEIDSEDGSSESSSDEEYDFSAVKNKYKEKYKHKYGAKYNTMKQNPYFTTPHQDAFILAKQNLQGKLNNELKKAAFSSLFG